MCFYHPVIPYEQNESALSLHNHFVTQIDDHFSLCGWNQYVSWVHSFCNMHVSLSCGTAHRSFAECVNFPLLLCVCLSLSRVSAIILPWLCGACRNLLHSFRRMLLYWFRLACVPSFVIYVRTVFALCDAIYFDACMKNPFVLNVHDPLVQNIHWTVASERAMQAYKCVLPFPWLCANLCLGRFTDLASFIFASKYFMCTILLSQMLKFVSFQMRTVLLSWTCTNLVPKMCTHNLSKRSWKGRILEYIPLFALLEAMSYEGAKVLATRSKNSRAGMPIPGVMWFCRRASRMAMVCWQRRGIL